MEDQIGNNFRFLKDLNLAVLGDSRAGWVETLLSQAPVAVAFNN